MFAKMAVVVNISSGRNNDGPSLHRLAQKAERVRAFVNKGCIRPLANAENANY